MERIDGVRAGKEGDLEKNVKSASVAFPWLIWLLPGLPQLDPGIDKVTLSTLNPNLLLTPTIPAP